MGTLDFRLEHDLNRYAGHHHFLDVLARHIAESQVEVAVAVLAVIGFGWVTHRNRFVLAGAAALAAAGLALLANAAVASAWFRARPFAAHPHLVHLLVHHPADASFPSDHAAALAGITVALLAFSRPLGLVALVWTLLVGLARVYVGEHYPGDILGGFAIGALVGGVVLRVLVSRAAATAIDRLPSQLREHLTRPPTAAA